MTQEQLHERKMRLVGAYTGFIGAAVLALVASDVASKPEAWAVSLWALSLPFLVSYLLLDFIVAVKQGREASVTRGFMSCFGLGLSITGTFAWLGSVSWFGAVAFLLVVALCVGLTLHVVFHGTRGDVPEL